MKVSMSEKNICLPNGKTMILDLIQSQLENIMKSKVIKKQNNLPVHKIKKNQKGHHKEIKCHHPFFQNRSTSSSYYCLSKSVITLPVPQNITVIFGCIPC